MKTILVDAWNTFVTESGINQSLYNLLEEYENPKIILTNADVEKQKELWLVNLPYTLFTLNFNPEKTNPEFYKIFLREYNLDTSDVIYFEHNIDAVNSAISLGIKTFHYQKWEDNIWALRDFFKQNL